MEWKRIFMNDHSWEFLLEVMLRSVIMFVIILVTLRASGKRGIKQLSIFELVLIIGLGSAAGDPMFYEDVGILPALIVFVMVISMYLAITKLTDKASWVEHALEGKPLYIIKNGIVIMKAFDESGLSQDELFAQLRVRNVEHLGQVKTVLIETSGEISVLFYADEEVVPGLPIYPEPLSGKTPNINHEGRFACTQCCTVTTLTQSKSCTCTGCECTEWVKPIQTKRIA